MPLIFLRQLFFLYFIFVLFCIFYYFISQNKELLILWSKNGKPSSLSDFYRLSLKACFSESLILRLAWNSYNDRIPIKNSEFIRIIESAGKTVQKNSTQTSRAAEIRIALTKLKDSIRKRSSRSDVNGDE